MSNVTDLDLLKQQTYMLLENGNAAATGSTLLTSMFSIPQMVNALNQRQWRFLKDTGVVMSQETIASPAGQQRYTFPNTYIDTRRLAYAPNGGSTYGLLRADAWEIDTAAPDWDYSSGDPLVWNESTLPTRTVEIAPIPANTGTLSHLYIALSATLTGLGVQLTVPDEFSWAILYGALADLLGSDGEGLDAERAAYCEQRYDQGVELCRLLLEGVMG